MNNIIFIDNEESEFDHEDAREGDEVEAELSGNNDFILVRTGKLFTVFVQYVHNKTYSC